MKKNSYKLRLLIGIVGIALLAAACGTPRQVDHVVDYQVIGDRSVKYIVVPAEQSMAGSMYMDQNVSLEICRLETKQVIGRDDDQRGVESQCRQTRLLRTQEYK